MTVTTALRLSYLVLALSLAAAAYNMMAFLNHWPVPANLALPLRIGGYLWPLAAYAVAVYRRKLQA